MTENQRENAMRLFTQPVLQPEELGQDWNKFLAAII